MDRNNIVFRDLDDVLSYLCKINDSKYLFLLEDTIMNSEAELDAYKWILEQVLALDEKPKRVVDIGSCLNQYAYLFVNEGIDYIGIDPGHMNLNPIETEHIQFVEKKYEDVVEEYANDVVISNLCVGWLVDESTVKAKTFINGKKYLELHSNNGIKR